MNIQQLLTKKRHAQELYDQEIEYFVKSACDGSLHASQIGKLFYFEFVLFFLCYIYENLSYLSSRGGNIL